MEHELTRKVSAWKVQKQVLHSCSFRILQVVEGEEAQTTFRSCKWIRIYHHYKVGRREWAWRSERLANLSFPFLGNSLKGMIPLLRLVLREKML